MNLNLKLMEIFKIFINENLKSLDTPLLFLGLRELLTDKGVDDLKILIEENSLEKLNVH